MFFLGMWRISWTVSKEWSSLWWWLYYAREFGDCWVPSSSVASHSAAAGDGIRWKTRRRSMSLLMSNSCQTPTIPNSNTLATTVFQQIWVLKQQVSSKNAKPYQQQLCSTPRLNRNTCLPIIPNLSRVLAGHLGW